MLRPNEDNKEAAGDAPFHLQMGRGVGVEQSGTTVVSGSYIYRRSNDLALGKQKNRQDMACSDSPDDRPAGEMSAEPQHPLGFEAATR